MIVLESTGNFSFFHDRTRCKLCAAGDIRTAEHPHWRIKVTLPYIPDPKKRRIQLHGFTSKSDAIRFLAKNLPDMDAGTFYPSSLSEYAVTRFDNYLEKYISNGKSWYESYRKVIMDFFSGKDLRKITSKDIQSFYRNLPERLAVNSKGLIMKVVKNIFREACLDGIIDVKPEFPIIRIKNKRERDYYTPEEQVAILEALPEKYQPVFAFMMVTSCRPSEAVNLTWQQISWSRETVKIISTKTEKETELPLHPLFLEYLGSRRGIGVARVFPDGQRQTLLYQLKVTCRKLGLPVLTLHEYSRHSFISNGQAEGCTFEQLSGITNNLSAMKAYSHSNMDSKRKVLDRLGRRWVAAAKKSNRISG